MASNAINPEHGAAYSTHRTHRDRRMRADYVLVSEERESGSEYSSSTCCCCSSCESGCSCEEYSEDEDEEEGDDDDDNDVVIEEEEEEEEEGYWSDCSACWARRDIGRRGRTGRRYGHRYMNIPRAVEASDSLQDHHHHHHSPRRHDRPEQHRRRNETPQRDQRNANHATFRNTNSIINGNNDGHSAVETPSFRGLVDRIISTTRQLRPGEEHTRHLRSWIRVLEDLQRLQYVNSERGANTTAASAPTSPPPRTAAAAGLVSNASSTIMAARAGRQSSSSGTVLGRATNVSSGQGGNGAAQAQTQAYPRRVGRSHFMSGGRSTSISRRRRLR